jgi:hypothetical protein
MEVDLIKNGNGDEISVMRSQLNNQKMNTMKPTAAAK